MNEVRELKERDINGKLRTKYYCIGINGVKCNNFTKTKGDKCRGCTTGRYRNDQPVVYQEGQKFERNGIRYKWSGGQERRLCSGKDNDCDNRAETDGLCNGCISGRYRTNCQDLNLGDIIQNESGRYKFDGHQLRLLCREFDDGCDKYAATEEGYCQLCSNGNTRQYLRTK